MAESVSSRWIDPAVLTRLMAQPLLARFPMQGNVSGQHKSPHRGSSVEFAEYRNYVPGDDPRRLDWRVFARTDRFYMKEFEAETNLRCYLVLDCSGSMGLAGAHGRKLDYAKRLLATLAYLVIHQGDAAGLVCIGRKTVFDIPPRRNPGHLQTILRTLDQVEPRGPTGLLPALHELAEQVPRRALVLLASDFFCATDELSSCLQHLRFQKHDLAVFHLLDRLEMDFPFDRPTRFADLESAFHLITEPAMVREAYQRHLRAWLDWLRACCLEFQVAYRSVLLDQPYEQVLADFLVERARQAAVAPR